MHTMRPGSRYSGRRAASPLRAIHVAFSQVTISSPNAASTIGLPESCTANLQQELHSLQLSQCSSTGRRGSDVIMCDQHIVSNADRVEPYLQIVSACSSMALFRMRMSCLRTEKLVSRHCSCAFRAFATAAATCTKLSCDRAVWSGSSFLLPVHPRKLLLHPASRCSPLCLMPSERFPRLLQWQDSCTPSGLLGRC